MNGNSIEQIIKDLSKIESLSEKIKYDTEMKRDEYVQYKRDEYEKFDSQLQKETKEQLIVLEDDIQKKVRDDIQFLREQNDVKIEKMENEFKKVYVQEAKDIVQRVIKE